jgi:hypothetical protein
MDRPDRSQMPGIIFWTRQQVPYMNKELKRDIFYRKKMMFSQATIIT